MHEWIQNPWKKTWGKKKQFCALCWSPHPGGGALNFFSGRGVRPGFPKCGACELTFASEKAGLWAENFQIWRLVSWKFPNLGACELKISKFGACELKFGWKLRLLRLKFPNFLKRGSCELTLLLEMGPLRAAGEAWKGGLQGRTSPYPLSRSVPPRAHILHWACKIVALKCVYIRNAWVIIPTQWSEIYMYSQWTSSLLLTSIIMMLSWLRGHNWVYFPPGHSVLLPCIQNFAFLKTWNCFSVLQNKTKQKTTTTTKKKQQVVVI